MLIIKQETSFFNSWVNGIKLMNIQADQDDL